MNRVPILFLFLVFCLVAPTAAGAQDAFLGVHGGRNLARLSADRSRSGPMVGLFAQVDLSRHVGVGWEVNWVRSAVDDLADPFLSSHPPIARPEYASTDLLGRLSWSTPRPALFGMTLGVTAVGGGWLGVRTGGAFSAPSPSRFDFGHVLGGSLFAVRGAIKVEAGLRAYHGEARVWEGGPTQRGSTAVIGIAYRIHGSMP